MLMFACTRYFGGNLYLHGKVLVHDCVAFLFQ